MRVNLQLSPFPQQITRVLLASGVQLSSFLGVAVSTSLNLNRKETKNIVIFLSARNRVRRRQM